jgi:hypothetical protein
MKENSRIRFNPVTKEIEVEGTEEFVKTYFDKLKAMISEATEKPPIKKEPKPVKAALVKVSKKKPGKKRITQRASVIELIQESPEGLSTAELKEKTGLTEIQIWNIVNHAAKEGKIRKMNRGLYGAVEAN